jgi:hypothetical protein
MIDLTRSEITSFFNNFVMLIIFGFTVFASFDFFLGAFFRFFTKIFRSKKKKKVNQHLDSVGIELTQQTEEIIPYTAGEQSMQLQGEQAHFLDSKQTKEKDAYITENEVVQELCQDEAETEHVSEIETEQTKELEKENTDESFFNWIVKHKPPEAKTQEIDRKLTRKQIKQLKKEAKKKRKNSGEN